MSTFLTIIYVLFLIVVGVFAGFSIVKNLREIIAIFKRRKEKRNNKNNNV